MSLLKKVDWRYASKADHDAAVAENMKTRPHCYCGRQMPRDRHFTCSDACSERFQKDREGA